MSTGLFLVRRESTWITRRISASRPMTGSSLPSRASSVRSEPYLARASEAASGFSEDTACPPRSRGISASIAFASAVMTFFSARASSRTSVDRNVSPSARIRVSACWSTARVGWPNPGVAAVWPEIVGRAETADRAAEMTAVAVVPPAVSRVGVVVSGCAARASARWAGVISA